MGKTSLLNSHFYCNFPEYSVATTIDSFIIDFSDEENIQHSVNVYEIGGSILKNETNFNQKLYPYSDLFVICYSVAILSSFKNVKNVNYSNKFLKKFLFFKFFLCLCRGLWR